MSDLARVLIIGIVLYTVVGAGFVWTMQFRVRSPVLAPASLAEGDMISEGASRE